AILGLGSLYFALAALMHRFVYLKYALSLVLKFIGCKILLHGLDIKIHAGIALGVSFALLAGGVLVSLYSTRDSGRRSVRWRQLRGLRGRVPVPCRPVIASPGRGTYNSGPLLALWLP